MSRTVSSFDGEFVFGKFAFGNGKMIYRNLVGENKNAAE